MKKLIFGLSLLAGVSACVGSEIEGFVYLPTSPDKLNAMHRPFGTDGFYKTVNWQYPIGVFDNAEQCRDAAKMELAGHDEHDGWACGVGCKWSKHGLAMKVCEKMVLEGY